MNGQQNSSGASKAESTKKEYIIIVTDGREELQAAARYLAENASDLVRPKNGLEIIIQQAPDVLSALNFWKDHVLEVPLVIAEKRSPASSGWRVKYVQSDFDHEMLTGVVDAYTERTPDGGDQRVDKLDLEALLSTVTLELREMHLYRRVLGKWDEDKRQSLAEMRRKRIEQILLEQGDYLERGITTSQVNKLADALNQPEHWITAVMRPLQAGDVDTATNLWRQLGEGGPNLAAFFGVTVFGQDQSIGGGYVVSDLHRLKLPLGFKRTNNYEEATSFKRATDFYINLSQENSEKAADSRGVVRQLWKMARLNIPRVIGVLQGSNGGVVFMEYKGLTIYPIGILNPDYPNILQEAIEMTKKGGEEAALASKFLDTTFLAAAKSLGFWRANPYTNPQVSDPLSESRSHYSTKETMFFSQVLPILDRKISERELESVKGFFDYLNSMLQLNMDDLAPRMDLRVEHIGYEVAGKPLPTARDVISAACVNGTLDCQKVYELQVSYDAGGKRFLAPRHHELSHIGEHPLVMWAHKETRRFTAYSMASQQMFTALRNRALKDASRWRDISESVKTGNLEDFLRASPEFAGFGSNELLINAYRDLEEARQILTIRLPRLYIRQERLPPESELAGHVEGIIATRINQFMHYVGRALTHLTDELSAYIQLPESQKSNLAVVREKLNLILGAKEIPKGKTLALWDGF